MKSQGSTGAGVTTSAASRQQLTARTDRLRRKPTHTVLSRCGRGTDMRDTSGVATMTGVRSTPTAVRATRAAVTKQESEWCPRAAHATASDGASRTCCAFHRVKSTPQDTPRNRTAASRC